MKVVLSVGTACSVGVSGAETLPPEGTTSWCSPVTVGPAALIARCSGTVAIIGTWASELEGAALINLAANSSTAAPPPPTIELVTRSRVEPTLALVDAASHLDEPVHVWVQMSTLAIYGDAGDAVLDEMAPPAEGPPQMAGVARAWETAASQAVTTRQVVLRTGIALDPDTPAPHRLTGLVRWGLGGRIDTGRQWISWIHIDDFLTVIRGPAWRT